MGPPRFFGVVILIQAGLLAGGVLAWALIRPPQGAARAAVLSDLDRVGPVRRAVADVRAAVKELAEITPRTPTDEVVRRRDRVTAASTAAARMGEEVGGARKSWVPVDEACQLLERGRELGEMALRLSPRRQVPEAEAAAADALEADPDRVGMTEDAALLLLDGQKQLLNDAEALPRRVARAAAEAPLARGSLFGFPSSDLLVAALALAVLLGWLTAWRATRLLRRPPGEVVRQEVETLARAAPPVALERCHTEVARLLELADRIVRGGSA